MRLPGTRVCLRRDRILERQRLAGEQVAQHCDRRAGDGAAVGLEQRAATDNTRGLGPLHRQVLRDTDEGIRVGRGERAEPRLHDEVAGRLLPAGARQAFREREPCARRGQRPQRPVIGLTGECERG